MDRSGATIIRPEAAGVGRLRQEVLDTRRRTLIGGMFYVLGWLLVALYSPLGRTHPWAAWGVGAGFLLLAMLRMGLRPPGPERDARQQHRWLDLQWSFLFATTALWGTAGAWVMLDPRFAEARTLVLLCTIAYSAACSHTLSMRLGRAMACMACVYLPALGTVWFVDTGTAPAWMLLVFLAYLVLALLSSHGEYRLRLDLDEQLRLQRDRFETLSRLDALTGLANRRHFSEGLEAEVARAHVDDQPLSLLILDIDHFKRFNDTHGHVAGDVALLAFAQRLRERFGDRGVHLARVGGEEFALLLPRHALDAAASLADAFRRSFADAPLDLPVGAGDIRTSIGVAALEPGEPGELLYLRADRALYLAKADGRDRVKRAGG